MFHELKATVYNDVALSWNKAFSMDGLKLGLNVNNIFGEDAPICYSCSLNGYDAGTYDLPGTFWAVTLKYGF
jgi:iron complex outermembrane receptor protein